jgi:uncharacterized membrane protein YbhN (UPF0104 family)
MKGVTRLQDGAEVATDRNSRIRTVIGLSVSIFSLAAVAWWSVHQKTPSFPTSGPKIGLILIAVALYGLATLARGFRWHAILNRPGIDHRRSDAVGLTVVGYMGNTVLPARGGEILRILLLGERSSSSRREILGSIVAERLLDALGLGTLFVLMTWIGVAGRPTGQIPAIVTVGTVVAAALGIGGYLRLRNRGYMARFATVARPFARATRLLYGRIGLALFFLTIAIWVIEGLIFWLLGRSLGLGIHPVDSLFLVVLTSFFLLVPAAPGYLGTFDAALLFGLGAIDVKGGQALSFVLLARFVLFVPITVAGALIMFTRYGGLRRLRSVATGAFGTGKRAARRPRTTRVTGSAERWRIDESIETAETELSGR